MPFGPWRVSQLWIYAASSHRTVRVEVNWSTSAHESFPRCSLEVIRTKGEFCNIGQQKADSCGRSLLHKTNSPTTKRVFLAPAFSGSKKTLYLVMCSLLMCCTLRTQIRRGAIAIREGAAMQNRDFSETLSPCLRIFLETLCNEANETMAESQVFFPFERVATQSQQQASSVLAFK